MFLYFCTQHPGIRQPFINAHSFFFFFSTPLGILWGLNKSSLSVTQEVTLRQMAEITYTFFSHIWHFNVDIVMNIWMSL